MSPGVTARVGAFHPRRWIVLAFISVLFSVILDLAYSEDGTHAGPALYKTASDRLIAIWIVAFVATGLAMLSAWRVTQRRPRAGRPASRGVGILASCLVAATVIGPAGLAAGAISSNAPHIDQLRQAMLTAGRLCHGGTGIDSAQPYGGADHRIAIVAATDDGSLADDQADVSVRAAGIAPLPDTTDVVQLVACIGQGSRVTLQTCSYTRGGTFARYGFTRDVSIYEARGGTLLDRQTYAGARPDACPEVKTVGEDQSEGRPVDWDDARIWDYLATWTSGPVRTAAPGAD